MPSFSIPMPPLALLAVLASPAFAAEVAVPPAGPAEVTVYGGDFGLVREHRTAKLPEAEGRLAFTGVSRQLQPETAVVEIGTTDKVKPSEVKILDQSFAFNLMTPQSLLEQSVGHDVSVVITNPATGRDITERGKVLSVQNGVVLDIGGKIHTGVPGRIVFDSLPGNLRPAPTLLVTASGPANTEIPIDLSYLTGGLGWRADYVAAYDGEAGRLDLTAWATVTNTTGVEFTNAKLKLVAGDVNHAAPAPGPRPLMRSAKMEMAAAQPAAEPGPQSPQTIAGMNIYTLPRSVTLSSGESKQLALFRVANLPVKRDYVVHGQPWFYTTSMAGQRQEGRVEIEVALKNEGRAKAGKKTEPAEVPGLGVALPAGVIRAYGSDLDGTPQFLGEDHIDHTPEGGELRLRLGRDVELPVVREQVSFVRAAESIVLSGWRLSFHNAKPKPVTVRVSEPVGGNWEISKETLAHTKSPAGTPEWTVTVPAKGDATLEYTIKTTL